MLDPRYPQKGTGVRAKTRQDQLGQGHWKDRCLGRTLLQVADKLGLSKLGFQNWVLPKCGLLCEIVVLLQPAAVSTSRLDDVRSVIAALQSLRWLAGVKNVRDRTGSTGTRLHTELLFRDFLRFSALAWGTSLFKIGGPECSA